MMGPVCVLERILAMEDGLDWGRAWAHTRQNYKDLGKFIQEMVKMRSKAVVMELEKRDFGDT